MVTRAGLRYTRDYLTPGICSLIKPAAMEKMISFRAKIHTVMLWYLFIYRKHVSHEPKTATITAINIFNAKSTSEYVCPFVNYLSIYFCVRCRVNDFTLIILIFASILIKHICVITLTNDTHMYINILFVLCKSYTPTSCIHIWYFGTKGSTVNC